MSADHTFIDLSGDVHQGREMTVTVWTNYFSTCPDYMIHLSELVQLRNKVIMIGTTMGSHLQIPRKEELGSGMITWAANVKKNLVVEWRLFYDNEESRRIPGAFLSSRSA
jgi:hypothetical protein